MASTGPEAYAPALSEGAADDVLHPQLRAHYSAGYPSSDAESISKAEGWAMMPQVKDIRRIMKAEGLPEGKLGVTWNNLTVKAPGADAMLHENVLSQFNIPQLVKESRKPPQLKTIIDNSHGCVKPGEMLLVLGRPGAGCTTLLKMLANRRAGYSEVTGDVHFGSLDHKEAQQYRGQIEVFFPTLTVGQTLDLATRMKVSHVVPSDFKNGEEYRNSLKDFLLKSVGISHTADTKVGDAYVRGVSGGERKRVSIIETLATRGSVFCWDNSTRGLDASTALEYTRAIRALTDVLGLTSIVTLYQAGNGIYDLFDKVLVLDQGQQLYYGPQEQARPFMEDLGFVCRDGANIADYLTGVVVPTERKIREGCENTFPATARAIRNAYEQSDIYRTMQQDSNYATLDGTRHNTDNFKQLVVKERDPKLPKKSQLTTGLVTQIRACVIRQYQILWGDKATFIIKQVSTIIQALIAGSLFYDAPATSAGLFSKSGALFFALLYNALVAMSEVTDSFTGRPVLAKHRQFAFYHPAAFCLAQITADIPVLLIQVSTFSLILYFMTGLEQSADAFFTFWIIVFAVTMAMTALFRFIGAAFPTFDAASKVSGFLIAALITYTGYMIRKPQMHPWFVWIYWIDPLSYGFSGLLANEFHNKIIPCAPPNLIPFGGNAYADAAYQACSGVGGQVPDQVFVTGEAYLQSLSYSHAWMWRNFGIVWVWWVLFVGLTIFFTSRWSMIDRGGFLLVPREKSHKSAIITGPVDEENPEKTGLPDSSGFSSADSSGIQTPATGDSEKRQKTDTGAKLIKNTSVFTWKNLKYTVPTPSGPRVLLNDVQGWVKPGMLGALMGSSGAGKTTLLDVLARRKTEGEIQGSIMIDGRPLPISFQRSAGYCEQLDVHESYATVREALEFSALLRQNRDTPDKEKLEYVDVIIDLLEMHDIEHTLIGRPGAGLTVEQRKRVTIGVELVAKPSILIFLDEPTSGLDGQAAFNTVRCLRKLADAGQAVLVTIHQPSAQLFAQFDTLLLLAKGGNTVYFGDIGDNGDTVKSYFGRYGAPCPKEANPAEHMIDVVSGPLSKGKDWGKVWLDSPEHSKVSQELDEIIADAAAKPPATQDDGHEFSNSIWYQTKLVTARMNTSLFRNTDYVNNKFMLHIGSALFNGFSFWMIGDSVNELQLTLFTIFNFIFVAPGVIAQLQPLFIERRDIYETREKKSKMYHWAPFVTGLIVSEIPYLCICAVFYFACWYYTVGLPKSSDRSGAIFFVMLIYEFVYTGIGQFVAAYAPNAVFAALVNPLIIGILVSFCGVLVPYAQIQSFWRYWMYYLNPFNYLMGSMLTFALWDKPVTCNDNEFAIFPPPANQTCGDYLAEYLAGAGHAANLVNPEATDSCRVCQYTTGTDYLRTLNLNEYYYGWRDAAIVVIFAFSSYALVFGLMKLRTKQTKTAS
ncbi:hypothetical protein FH972_026460 [Carpinus fangiana]|uniref:ABC transporter domain-containing protein n=1 Tax=Carpinus fangiana TaxID=176857 RepID=A0A5N6L431_9ROSI|nr:hypothetical protein FH972_026460 [Carpinus fangiana]